MRDFQLPIETFFSSYLDLTGPDNELVDYFRHIRMSHIEPVLCAAYNNWRLYAAACLLLYRWRKVARGWLAVHRLLGRVRLSSSQAQVSCRAQSAFAHHDHRHPVGQHRLTQKRQ